MGSELDLAVNAELVKAVQAKRLIFSVTTGRSGTAYVAELLGGIPDVRSVHEPEPDFVHAMRRAQTDPSVAKDFLQRTKLPSIARDQRLIYVETSHLFCKGFLEPLLEMAIVPDLIILKRPRREVAKSLWELNTIPGRTEKGLKYLLHPGDPVYLPIERWEALSDYELCYWYCLEIEKRQEVYEKLTIGQGGRAVVAHLHEIRTLAGIEKLLANLDLPEPGRLMKMKRVFMNWKNTNKKKDRKREWNLEDQVGDLERRILSMVDMPLTA